MQLERLLRSQGYGSRPECRALIARGRVRIDGAVCADPYAEYSPEGFVCEIDGERVDYREFAYLMLNKPAGFECSQKPRHHPSVYSLLTAPLLARGVQAVGRLDEDTTGLLLFSDDGQFIHRYTSPKKKIAKVYDVTAKHPVDAGHVSALLAGVQLHDEPLPIAAAACEIVGERRLRLTLTEGKYHLVKRMIAAAGNRVEALQREAIGALTLPADLAPGAWRWLDGRDLQALAQPAAP